MEGLSKGGAMRSRVRSVSTCVYAPRQGLSMTVRVPNGRRQGGSTDADLCELRVRCAEEGHRGLGERWRVASGTRRRVRDSCGCILSLGIAVAHRHTNADAIQFFPGTNSLETLCIFKRVST
eukprot:6408689-Pyramimonas_sp.AAC.1